MEILRKIGTALAGFMAVLEIIGQIIGFLAIPALIVIVGLLNGLGVKFYVIAIGIYVLLYLAAVLIGKLIGKHIGLFAARKIEEVTNKTGGSSE